MRFCKIVFTLFLTISFCFLYGCGGGGSGSNQTPVFIVNHGNNNNTNGNSQTINDVISHLNGNNDITTTTKIPEENIKKPWLFIVYAAADNDNILIDQLTNLNSLEAVGSDKNTHIVEYIDIGDPKENIRDWENTGWTKTVNWIGARGFYIKKDDNYVDINSTVISNYGTVDSGSKDFLETCLKDAMTRFPADNICLVLNNHGGGYMGLLCDYKENTIMSNNDVKEAIENAEKASGKHINILGFDACVMAELEPCYEYKDVTDYILASEELASSVGWHYEEILTESSNGITTRKTYSNSKFGMLPRMAKLVQNRYKAIEERLNQNSTATYSKISSKITPYDFAKLIFDISSKYKTEVMTFSIIDTSQLEELKNAVNDFSKNVIDLDEKNLQYIKKCLLLNTDGGYAIDYGYYSIYDLCNMMDSIISCENITNKSLKSSAERVKDRITYAVIANSNSGDIYEEYAYSYGLSIFYSDFPSYIDPIDKESYTNLTFTKETKWFDMMKKLQDVDYPQENYLDEKPQEDTIESN